MQENDKEVAVDGDDELMMSGDTVCDELQQPPTVSTALPIQSNAHAFHRQLPPHFLGRNDGVPLVTEFAHRKARQIIELVHSMQLHDGMFNETQPTLNAEQQQQLQSSVDEEDDDDEDEDNNETPNEKDCGNETLVRNKKVCRSMDPSFPLVCSTLVRPLSLGVAHEKVFQIAVAV
jgi:hypothetical protein